MEVGAHSEEAVCSSEVAARVSLSRSRSEKRTRVKEGKRTLSLLPFCRILEPPHELVVHVGREFLKLLPRQAGQLLARVGPGRARVEGALLSEPALEGRVVSPSDLFRLFERQRRRSLPLGLSGCWPLRCPRRLRSRSRLRGRLRLERRRLRLPDEYGRGLACTAGRRRRMVAGGLSGAGGQDGRVHRSRRSAGIGAIRHVLSLSLVCV